MWRSLRLCTAVVGVVSANTAWTVCNRKLLKDGALFFIRGVNYQPAPIDTWSGVDLLLRPELWQRDLPLLRNMNANAAKVYAFTSGNPDGHNAYLDAAFNNGYLPIYTMFSIWVSPYPMSAAVAIDSPDFAQFVPKYEAMAKEVACHPGTMGFVIGGEMNGIWEVKTQLFWSKFNALSQAVRRGIASANCASPAPKILTTNFIDDYAASVTYGEQFRADVDVWGINIYDKRFGSDKMLVHSRATSRPFLFGGHRYAQHTVYHTLFKPSMIGAASWDVGLYLMSMANLLRDSFLGKDPSGTAVLVGGFIFEFTDEWWKQGFPSSQEFGWDPAPIFPMGYGSEEFFGLFSRTAFAPCPTIPSKSTCVATLSDLNMGLGVVEDGGCAGGGIGCDATRPTCRYCKMKETAQSKLLNACPGVTSTSTSGFAAADDSESAVEGTSTTNNASTILLLVATVVGVVVAGVLVAKVVFRKPKKSEKQGEVAMHTPSGAGIFADTMSPIRNLVKYPNRVKELQALFTKNPHLHGAENPTFLKGPNDQAIFYTSIALFGLGTVQTLRGWVNMSFGWGKVE
ncbi:hypothetical protein DYB37_000435 [Aphanomyces astaci]|uniref:Uncharacterized protein n=2 Tax=Aphanomyces astaci TaxID=112090 RepID=A0A3R6X6C5_APHAT|nr:hypothetical protein DYB35_000375 [Aphanomyces astaci]RHZ22530.1 hypothetical protein DYB37_000435 [Aphanomyces astaci]